MKHQHRHGSNDGISGSGSKNRGVAASAVGVAESVAAWQKVIGGNHQKRHPRNIEKA